MYMTCWQEQAVFKDQLIPVFLKQKTSPVPLRNKLLKVNTQHRPMQFCFLF